MAILPEPRWLPLANDAAGENTPTTPELPLTLDVKIACPVRFPQPLARVLANAKTAHVGTSPTYPNLPTAIRAPPAGTTRTIPSLQKIMSRATSVLMIFP